MEIVILNIHKGRYDIVLECCGEVYYYWVMRRTLGNRVLLFSRNGRVWEYWRIGATDAMRELRAPYMETQDTPYMGSQDAMRELTAPYMETPDAP